MFLKPFHVRSQTAIKGSERKRVRAELSRQYPALTDEASRVLIPNKGDMTVTRLTTHSGTHVTVYTVETNPIAFELDTVLFPTVYALWSQPSLVTLMFTTWPPVLTKLQGGADLMLPGVVLPRPSSADPRTPRSEDGPLGNFVKNQGCTVNLVGCRSCVAVGRTALSSAEMRECSMKGKGVIVLHTYLDHLWALGDKSSPPIIPCSPLDLDLHYDESASDDDQSRCGSAEANQLQIGAAETNQLQNSITESNESQRGILAASLEGEEMGNSLNLDEGCLTSGKVEDVTQRIDGLAVEEGANEGFVELPYETGRRAEVKIERMEGATCVEEDKTDEKNSAQPEISSQESMDSLLQTCFLQALKAYRKRAELPILTSTFFRNHILPCCPRGSALDVKKSSYKKLSKFLAVKQSEGLLKVKERTKGVESIVDIDFDHDDLRAFKPPAGVLSGEEGGEQGREENQGTAAGGGAFTYAPPQIVDVYLVSPAVQGLFNLAGRRKGEALRAAGVREIITDYVKSNGLQNQTNKGLVTLDAVLSDACLARGEYLEVLSWEDVVQRVLAKMTRAHEFTPAAGGGRGKPEIRKGAPEPIRLDVVQRGAGKKVTTVQNLELYGIDAAEFAATIQRGVACSASVSADPSKSRNKNSQICLAQGNQIAFIASLLTEKYQLPTKYIEGLEKEPKRKK